MTSLARVSLEDGRGVALARVSGEIDLSNTEEVAEALDRSITDETPGLVLDFSRVTYLDSAGVRLLFQLVERLAGKGKRLRMVVPEGSAIRKVLVVAAVDRAVPLDLSVEDAVAALDAAS